MYYNNYDLRESSSFSTWSLCLEAALLLVALGNRIQINSNNMLLILTNIHNL